MDNGSTRLPLTMASHKTLLFPQRLKCFAVNNLIHHLFVATKETIAIYSLETDTKIKEYEYARILKVMYESEIKINFVEALTMLNLWITVINKKSFLFWNNKLEYSKIFQPESNIISELHVHQRYDTMFTLREDRKLLKFWTYEVKERKNVPTKDPALFRNEDYQLGAGVTKVGRDLADEVKKKKLAKSQDNRVSTSHYIFQKGNENDTSRLYKEKHYKLEATVLSLKSIYLDDNIIIRVEIAQELGLVVILQDDNKISFWSVEGGHFLWKFSPNDIPEVNYRSILLTTTLPFISINQEMLYFYYLSTIVIYDMVTQQQVYREYFPQLGKIYGFSAGTATKDHGIMLMAYDGRIFNISTQESTKMTSNSHILNMFLGKIIETVSATSSEARKLLEAKLGHKDKRESKVLSSKEYGNPFHYFPSSFHFLIEICSKIHSKRTSESGIKSEDSVKNLCRVMSIAKEIKVPYILGSEFQTSDTGYVSSDGFFRSLGCLRQFPQIYLACLPDVYKF